MKSGVRGPEPHFHRDEEDLQIEIESEVEIAVDRANVDYKLDIDLEKDILVTMQQRRILDVHPDGAWVFQKEPIVG